MTDKTPAQAFGQFEAARTDWTAGMKARRAAAKPAPVATAQDLRERTAAQVRAELASARAQLDPSYVFSDDSEHFRRHDAIAGRVAALSDELERLQ